LLVPFCRSNIGSMKFFFSSLMVSVGQHGPKHTRHMCVGDVGSVGRELQRIVKVEDDLQLPFDTAELNPLPLDLFVHR
jgi:hypothetical protein